MQHTVLFVDDDPNVLAGLSRAFRKRGYTVLTAGSAQEGFKILESGSVDAIVTDEEMPGMSGTNFLKQVRAIYPDTARLILTGKATLPMAIDAINEGGISRFFVKPCDSVALEIALRQELEKRDLIVAARRLLQRTKRQDAVIMQLEQKYPHIADVRRDLDGAVLLDDIAGDAADLIDQICNHLQTRQ